MKRVLGLTTITFFGQRQDIIDPDAAIPAAGRPVDERASRHVLRLPDASSRPVGDRSYECEGTQVALPTEFLTSEGVPAARGGRPMTVQLYRPPAPVPPPMNSKW